MANRLIVTVERISELDYSCEHRFDLDYSGDMVVLEEGVDPHKTIIRKVIRWRIEKRPSGLFYCSRFTVNRKELVPPLLDDLSGHLRPGQEEIGVTIETKIPQVVDQSEVLFPFPPSIEPLVARSTEVGPTSEIAFRKIYLVSGSKNPSR